MSHPALSSEEVLDHSPPPLLFLWTAFFGNESNPGTGGVEQVHSNAMSTFIYDLPVRMNKIYLDDFKSCPRGALRSEMVYLTCHTGNGDSTIRIHTVHLSMSYINHFISPCLSWHSQFRVEILLILPDTIYFKYWKLCLWLYFFKGMYSIVPLCGIWRKLSLTPKLWMCSSHVTDVDITLTLTYTEIVIPEVTFFGIIIIYNFVIICIRLSLSI